MHPILVAALVEDRSRFCPCGAVFDQPNQLCRKCFASMTWRCGQSQRSRNIGRRPAHQLVGACTWILAAATLVLRAIGKRAS